MRDRLSSDNWRVLNRLLQLFDARSRRAGLDDALELLDDALVSLVAVGGLEMAHMTRDDGWRFLSLGRHLERLHFVSSTLGDVASHRRATPRSGLLEWLLELSDSLHHLSRPPHAAPRMGAVVDLLLVRRAQPAIGCVPAGEARQARPAAARRRPRSTCWPRSNELLRRLPRRRPTASRGSCSSATRRLEALSRATVSSRSRCASSDALSLRYFSHVDDVPRATAAI